MAAVVPEPTQQAIALRRELAAHPEPSGQEADTARMVAAWLEDAGLHVETGIGGHGILAHTTAKGKAMLWRAELDAVQARDGLGHHCGHDGHMAMLCGALARMQAAGRPVTAFFQPAEETGEGMARCLEDPRLADLEPEAAYAIHNVPGVEEGAVVLGPGAMASTGLRIILRGQSSHAAEPWEGRSPWPELQTVAQGIWNASEGDPRATLVHARLGTESYGTSPGLGIVAATLRGTLDEEVDRLAESLHPDASGFDALQVVTERVEPFPATRNHAAGLDAVEAAAQRAGLPVVHRDAPWPWSEDFGHALRRWPGALIGLGSGIEQPPLHDAGYRFPDTLVEKGVRLWCSLGGIT